MSDRTTNQVGAVGAIVGAVLLLAGTFLHPFEADPNDPLAAFTEYAADRLWVASHLTQLIGVLLMVFAFVLLKRMMASGRGASWAQLGVVGATASLSAAAALQAVDGIALKKMVDAWAAASTTDKGVLFQAAFGVRQVEVGLAAIVSLLFGITVTIYGVAIVSDHNFPRWLGWLAFAGGVPTAGAGIAIAYTGFSGVAMTASMSASVLVLIWIVLVGIWMWRFK